MPGVGSGHTLPPPAVEHRPALRHADELGCALCVYLCLQYLFMSQSIFSAKPLEGVPEVWHPRAEHNVPTYLPLAVRARSLGRARIGALYFHFLVASLPRELMTTLPRDLKTSLPHDLPPS